MSRLLFAISIPTLLLVGACGGSDSTGPKTPEPPEQVAEDDGDDEPATRHQDDEEDDDEGMEIEGLSGHLDPMDIEKGIQPHADKLASCYHDAVKQMRFIDGKVELGYKVGRNGEVKSAYMKQSDLGAWPVELCLLETARAMQFKKPRGRGDADFSVPLDFTSGRSRTRWLSEEQAESEVKDYLGELGECAQEVGKRNPKNVWVTLYVGARGKVKSVGFASATALADEWATCAQDRAMAWQLTDPRGRIAKMAFLYNPR